MNKVIDFETDRRQQKLSDEQEITGTIWMGWISAGLLILAWVKWAIIPVTLWLYRITR